MPYGHSSQRIHAVVLRLSGFMHNICISRVKPAASWIFAHRIVITGGVFALAILLQLHGSSIGIWDSIVKEKTGNYSYSHFGRDRYIRWDEWHVSTPWQIAQTSAHPSFPDFNRNLYTSGMYMGLTIPPSPVRGMTLVGQIHNWGYILFGAARGLSWSWWMRYLGLFLVATQFILLATHNNRKLALAGGLSITLASPTQWWDTTVPFHLFYLLGFCVFFWNFLHAKGVAKSLLSTLGGVVFFCSFALTLYPPFQLPLAYMLIAICVCMAFPRNHSRLTATHYIAGAIGFTTTAYVIWLFLANNQHGIAIIANTAYPGERSFSGGTMTNWTSLLWPMLSLYFPFKQAPILNNCECSLFLVPFPGLLLVAYRVFVAAKPSFEKRLAIVFLSIGLILLCWSLFPFPKILSEFSLLSIIPPRRAMLTASFALQMSAIICLFVTRRDKLYVNRPVSWITTLAAVLVLLAYIAGNEAIRGYYFPPSALLSGLLMLTYSLILFGTINYTLMRGKIHLFSAAIVLYALTAGLAVHPLGQGISPLSDKMLGRVCRQLQAENPSAKWIDASEQGLLSQFLTALGLPTISGNHCVPDVDFWRQLDPEGVHEIAYNRYANVRVTLTEERLGFENPAPDSLHVRLRPIDLRKLSGLYFLISSEKLDPKHFKLAEYMEIDKLYIYRYMAD